MDFLYKIFCIKLIEHFQRENMLSTDSEKLFEELEEITELDRQGLESLDIF